MPVDPYTGEELPYGPYDGPWPPPEWGEDPTALPPVVPDAPQATIAPEAQQAAAAADALFAQPQAPVGVEMGDAIIEDGPGVAVEMGDAVLEPETAPALPADFEVDAVSGGELPPDAPLAAPEPALLTNPNNQKAAAEESERDRVAGMSSDDLAMEQFESNQAAQAEQRAAHNRALLEKAQDEEDNVRVFRESRAAADEEQKLIEQDAAILANEKIDPDGWRSSRNMFQTIAMYVAGIVGGLMQTRNGGVNVGLQMIDNEIARHIQGQRENLAHRRQMLGDRREALADSRTQAADLMRQEQAFAIGAYDRAIAEADAEAMQYDEQGNRRRQTEMFKRELMARRAQVALSIHDANRKKAEDDLRLQMDYEKHLSQLAKDEAARQKLLRGTGASAAKAKKTVTEWNAMFPGAKVPDDSKPRTLAEYRALSEVAKSVTEPTEGEKVASAEAREAKKAQLRNPLAKPDAKGNRFLLNADKKPATSGDPEVAKTLNTQMAAMTTLAQLVAQQKERISATSAVDLANPRSDAAKILKSNQATIANLLREGYRMGTLDEAAMELAKTVQGGDPTAFVGDASVGLEQMLVQAEIKLDNDLKTIGGWSPAEGENFRLPRYEAPKAKKDRYVDEAAGKGVSLEGGSDVFFKGPRMAEGQAISVRKITEKAAKGDAQAVSDLAGLASDAPNPAVKDAAAAALSELAKAGNALAAAEFAKALEAVSLTKEGE